MIKNTIFTMALVATVAGAQATEALLPTDLAQAEPAAIPMRTDIPVALQVAAGQEPYLQLHATGVQIYECAAKADAPGTWAWQFRKPEATLVDATGKPIGRQVGGPSWASNDGATVVGQIVASAPAPESGNIPWLLANIKSRDGQGMLTRTSSVQRVDTEGGVAPVTACSVANAQQVERVKYTATYIFWRLKTV